MLSVIIYDIVDDRRRDKVHSVLKDFGLKVQFSAFEAHLQPRERAHLLKRVGPLLDPGVDRFAIYPVSREQERNICCIGRPRPEHKATAFFII